MTLALEAPRRLPAQPFLLLGALAGATAIRVAAAGPAGPVSIRAGLIFAGCLVAATVAAGGSRTRLSRRVIAIGVAGAAVLLVPVLLRAGHAHPASAYLPWAAATAVVATAEEALLRGALFDALARWRGSDVAVVGGAIAFAALHVPLYGWHVLPLDLAVGLLLGAFRLVAGTWTAPAIAHVGADLAGWWLL